MTQLCYPGRSATIPIAQGAVWARGPVQNCEEREKNLHLLEFEPATMKPLSSRYNECAMPVSQFNVVVINTDLFTVIHFLKQRLGIASRSVVENCGKYTS
jgi:hypothetical protein